MNSKPIFRWRRGMGLLLAILLMHPCLYGAITLIGRKELFDTRKNKTIHPIGVMLADSWFELDENRLRAWIQRIQADGFTAVTVRVNLADLVKEALVTPDGQVQLYPNEAGQARFKTLFDALAASGLDAIIWPHKQINPRLISAAGDTVSIASAIRSGYTYQVGNGYQVQNPDFPAYRNGDKRHLPLIYHQRGNGAVLDERVGVSNGFLYDMDYYLEHHAICPDEPQSDRHYLVDMTFKPDGDPFSAYGPNPVPYRIFTGFIATPAEFLKTIHFTDRVICVTLDSQLFNWPRFNPGHGGFQWPPYPDNPCDTPTGHFDYGKINLPLEYVSELSRIIKSRIPGLLVGYFGYRLWDHAPNKINWQDYLGRTDAIDLDCEQYYLGTFKNVKWLEGDSGFSFAAADAIDRLGEFRVILDRLAASGKPVYLQECGMSTAPVGQRLVFYGPINQQRLISEVLKEFRAGDTDRDLADGPGENHFLGVHLWMWQDDPDWELKYGLNEVRRPAADQPQGDPARKPVYRSLENLLKPGRLLEIDNFENYTAGGSGLNALVQHGLFEKRGIDWEKNTWSGYAACFGKPQKKYFPDGGFEPQLPVPNNWRDIQYAQQGDPRYVYENTHALAADFNLDARNARGAPTDALSTGFAKNGYLECAGYDRLLAHVKIFKDPDGAVVDRMQARLFVRADGDPATPVEMEGQDIPVAGIDDPACEWICLALPLAGHSTINEIGVEVTCREASCSGVVHILLDSVYLVQD